MPVEGFNYNGGGIPAVGMQPVRQSAHRVAADQTQKAPDPDDHPARFNQPADLPAVHSVSDYLQSALGIPSHLTTDDAMLGTKIFQRGSIRASRAELLDKNGKAM